MQISRTVEIVMFIMYMCAFSGFVVVCMVYMGSDLLEKWQKKKSEMNSMSAVPLKVIDVSKRCMQYIKVEITEEGIVRGPGLYKGKIGFVPQEYLNRTILTMDIVGDCLLLSVKKS